MKIFKKLKMKRRIYGWKPDIPDFRDYKYGKLFKVMKLKELPPKVDLRSECSTVEDQGSLGSCTANALVGALEYIENQKGMTFEDLSRLFVYYNERVIEGTVDYDAGAYLRDGIKTLADQGVCSEELWPYCTCRYTKKPKQECYDDALNHQILAYERLGTIQEMKSCLADGFPFVFGFAVYESFETSEVAKTGMVPMPDPSEKLLGGHAVLAVGYDDSTGRFIVRNSWGTGWGDSGYFYMPYEYLTNPDLSADFWTIRDLEA